jgi:hypothetical protein
MFAVMDPGDGGPADIEEQLDGVPEKQVMPSDANLSQKARYCSLSDARIDRDHPGE